MGEEDCVDIDLERYVDLKVCHKKEDSGEEGGDHKEGGAADVKERHGHKGGGSLTTPNQNPTF